MKYNGRLLVQILYGTVSMIINKYDQQGIKYENNMT